MLYQTALSLRKNKIVLLFYPLCLLFLPLGPPLELEMHKSLISQNLLLKPRAHVSLLKTRLSRELDKRFFSAVIIHACGPIL